MKNRGLGFYFTEFATLASLLSAILYGICRENRYPVILVMLILATVAGAVVSVKPFRLTEFFPFTFNAIAVGFLLLVLLNNLADIMAKNNVLGLSAPFVVAFVLSILALLCSAVAVVLPQKKEVIKQ